MPTKQREKWLGSASQAGFIMAGLWQQQQGLFEL